MPRRFLENLQFLKMLPSANVHIASHHHRIHDASVKFQQGTKRIKHKRGVFILYYEAFQITNMQYLKLNLVSDPQSIQMK